jgi:hypothetical protein
LGAHVVTPRCGYLHHGIYVGGGNVVHYSGLARGLRRGPVEEISLAGFTDGHSVWTRSNAPPNFDRGEVIRRARSRVGEDRYRILSNNCEHFCEWCLRGEHRSYQVDAWLAPPLRLLRVSIGLISKLTSLPAKMRLRVCVVPNQRSVSRARLTRRLKAKPKPVFLTGIPVRCNAQPLTTQVTPRFRRASAVISRGELPTEPEGIQPK